jgi:outer membrane protein assembly factor BamB
VKTLALLACAALLLAGCGGGTAVREPPAELKPFSATLRVTKVWSVAVGASAVNKGVILSPRLDGNRLYDSDPKGEVSAYAADTGQRLWRTALDRPVTGATAAAEGLVVVATKKGEVVALAAADGRLRWIATVTSEVLAPAAIHAGVVVVQSADGKLTAFSAADGKRLWVYERTEPPLSLYGTAAPVVVGDVVLTGFASGKIVGVQLRDGKLLWEIPVAQPRGRNEIERLVDVDASPLVVGGTLYAASYQGKIIAVDLQSGRILWSREVSTDTGLAADSKNVYLTDEHGEVIALDQRTGASVWRQEQLRGRGLSAPCYDEGLVAVGDFEGYVHWLSAEDGRFLARYRASHSPIRAQPLAADGLFYLSSQSETLEALRLEKN